MENKTISFCMFSSPIGDLKLFATDDALIYVQFPEALPFRVELYLKRFYRDFHLVPSDSPILKQTRIELLDYFDHPGRPFEFSLPIELKGTPYQRRVWEQIAAIPYGKVITYGTLASWCGGASGSSRSAGAGCGANPISIVVPCHRILGTNRKLVGFGGGLAVKEWLLCHEGNDIRNHRYLGEFYTRPLDTGF
ncbi:MAG TPA: methylated-DNA--[protein]-cysteine S-methyltransferase [Candidatus Galloscillospira excrementipullorum]|nr:methylated-DNA--[protein]-cysteine S-methyltransferase [Candidatus Galloscillospira excrementipullorum]